MFLIKSNTEIEYYLCDKLIEIILNSVRKRIKKLK